MRINESKRIIETFTDRGCDDTKLRKLFKRGGDMKFKLLIQDPQNLLCELDRHQIENIVWLRLSPVEEEIQSVSFKSSRSINSGSTENFGVKISVVLATGKVVHVRADTGSKLNSILAATDLMGKHVRNRVMRSQSSLVKSFTGALSRFGSSLRSYRRRAANTVSTIREPVFFASKTRSSCGSNRP